MLLMHWLERMDVLPPSDFGVCEGYRVLKSFLERPTPATLREPAQASGCLVSVAHTALACWPTFGMLSAPVEFDDKIRSARG